MLWKDGALNLVSSNKLLSLNEDKQFLIGTRVKVLYEIATYFELVLDSLEHILLGR